MKQPAATCSKRKRTLQRHLLRAAVPLILIPIATTTAIATITGRLEPKFRVFELGVRPLSMITADLDLDGRPDFVTTNDGANSLTVGLARGDGMFASIYPIPIGEDVRDLVAGDFDGDGRLDLAATKPDVHSLAVLLGGPSGSFGAPRTVPTGFRPTAIATGDLNGDGRLDLAVTNMKVDSLTVLLGNGDGSFTFRQLERTASGPLGVAIADLDGDGPADLLIACGNVVSVMRGLGDGSFLPRVDHATGVGFTAFVMRDLNHDLRPDVAVIGSSHLSVLLNDGAGGFPAHTTTSLATSLNAIAAADRDVDGTPDLVVAAGIGRLIFLKGQGNGTFIADGDAVTAVDPTAVALADFDGDGALDVLAAGYHGMMALVLAHPPEPPRELVTPPNPYRALILDLTSDALPDVVIFTGLSDPPHRISVFPGDGAGSFAQRIDHAASGLPWALADLNEDGILDLVTLGPYLSAFVGAGLGYGDGTFGSTLISDIGSDAVGLAVGDFVEDGHLDVVVLRGYYGNNGLSIFRGRGDGTFQPRIDLAGDFGVSNPESADLDGDGHADLVAMSPQQIFVSFGDGAGNFPRKVARLITSFGQSLSLGDMDDDGQPDIVTSNYWGGASNGVDVLITGSTGQPGPFLYHPAGERPEGNVLGDLDGDGTLDVITFHREFNIVSFLRGMGDGTLATYEALGVGPTPTSAAIGDLDLDGLPDLVVTNTGSATATVFLQRAQPPVAVPGPTPGSVRDLEMTVGPNPSTGTVKIEWVLAREAPLQVSVMDVQGRRLERIRDAMLPAGRHTAAWTAPHGATGARAGMYFVEVRTPEARKVQRIVIMP